MTDKVAAQHGPYTVLHRLTKEETGMGDVYLAQVHPRYVARSAAFNLPRQVVLKASKLEFQLQDRLRKEAQLLQRCQHPNIVRIFPDPRSHPENLFYTAAYAIDGAQRYQYAMEYVGQTSAQQLLEQQGRLSVVDTIRIGIDIAQALDHIHAQQMLNLDVKPSNIVLRPHKLWSCLGGQAPQAVLCDFGTARLLTDRAHSYGTDGFSSPEQWRERPGRPSQLDHRSDLFSLGATLYTLLAGVPPHKSSAEYYARPPEPVQKHNPRVSLQLSTVIAKALAVDPGQRYQTAREFQQALEAVAPFWQLRRCQKRALFGVALLCLLVSAFVQPATRGYLATLTKPLPMGLAMLQTTAPSEPSTAESQPTAVGTPLPTAIAMTPTPPIVTVLATVGQGNLRTRVTRVPTRQPVVTPTITLSAISGSSTLVPTTSRPAPIIVIDPKPGTAINGEGIVRWRWAGTPAANQSFEILLWHTLDADQPGAADANSTTPERTKVSNGEYAYQFNLHTAASVRRHGEGEYTVAVALVEINPYRRIGLVSAPVGIRVTN